MQGSKPREPVTTGRITAVCRELLVAGGPEAVVIREVARRLSVTAPALYKHVSGRDDLLTLLITACGDEATQVCRDARDACPPDDFEAQLRLATWAFRAWAIAHPAEFGLVYGQPIAGYAAPEDGPTSAASQRFGSVFSEIFVGLLQTGRLRTVAEESLEPAVRDGLLAYAATYDVPLHPGELYPFVVGWHRMLGTISVEVSGHLQWVLPDAEPFVRRQLDDLADELILPAERSGP